jgi:DNA polymerase-4
VSERLILHADMDAFYASIEQRDHPELRGKPVIVGAASRRGVVAACSYEARKFGVRSAMPGFRARELCPQAIFVSSDMEKYVRVSGQVQRVFEEFTPLVEPLALDEAFLDITASAHLFGGPVELAKKLRARVREETELAVSCGVAPNKLVAKIACSLGKPDGLRYVAPSEVRALLDPLPIRWLWGVGPVAERSLVAAGFHRIADLANAELRALKRVVGEHAAELQARARGEDDRDVIAEAEAKSYGEENTFERDVSSREIVTRALTSHAHAVAERVRHDGVVGKTVTIKIKLARARGQRGSRSEAGEEEPKYPLLTRSRTLRTATDDAAAIRKVAIELWDAARVEEPVRLLGVALSGLAKKDQSQLSLFDEKGPGRRAQSEKLGPALDAIR